MIIIKDYYCEHCKRVIQPYELETTHTNGVQKWRHKKCGEKKIIRVDPKPEIQIDKLEDLFE